MRKRQIFQPGGFWLVTIAAVIWGTIGVVTRAIYDIDGTTPLFINLTRMLIAAPILLVICWRVVGRKMFNIQRRDFVIMILTGTFLVLSQAAYFAGIQYTGVTITTLLTLCISPLVVAFASVVLKFEALTRRYLVALLCALIGSVLLVGLPAQESAQFDLHTGVLYSLASAVCYAGMLICGRFVAVTYNPLQVTAIGFAAGTVVLLLINLVSGVVIVQTTQGWILVLYLGLLPTAFAYWLFQKGLRTIPATTASIVIMLDPLVAASLAWMLFGETLTATGLIGATLLMLSLFTLAVGKRV